MQLLDTVVEALENSFSLSLVGLVDIKHVVPQEAREVSKVGAERHIS